MPRVTSRESLAPSLRHGNGGGRREAPIESGRDLRCADERGDSFERPDDALCASSGAHLNRLSARGEERVNGSRGTRRHAL